MARWILAILAVLALGALVAPLSPARGDLDIGMPPGTPLEWDKDFPQPTPTPRGGVPAVTDEYKEREREGGNEGEDGPDDQRTAPLPDPVEPPSMDFTIRNLYSYFNVLTHDIMIHLVVDIPAVRKFEAQRGSTETTPDGGPVITGPGGEPLDLGEWEIRWRYQPDYPVELVWDAITTCLRAILHPEVMSNAQARGHLIELGVPAGIGARIGGGPFAREVRGAVGELPNQAPSVPSGGTPFNRMASRLAAMELTAGYPQALDPNYARHILALGDEGLPALTKAAKSSHTFLRRNAVAALTNYRGEDVTKLLRKLAKDRDTVIAIRALKGLMRRRDPGAARLFKTLLGHNDPMWRAIGAMAFGRLGDPEYIDDIAGKLDRAVRAGSVDDIWALLPALTRLGEAGHEELVATLRDYKKSFAAQIPGANAPDAGGQVPAPAAGPGRPRFQPQSAQRPEKVGFKNQVFYEMCVMALATYGDEDNRVEFERLIGGAGVSGVHKSNWYLACDAAERLGSRGLPLLKRIVQSAMPVVAVYALNRLANMRVEPEYLYDQTKFGRPMVRAAAVIALSQKDGDLAKKACQEIVNRVSANTPDGAQAFLLATALQIGGQLSAFTPESVIGTARTAFDARAFARRVGNNDPDITKSNVSVFPPLLETAVFEAARTGHPDAQPLLISVLRAQLPAGSAEAALGLGNFRSRASVNALIAALNFRDGWTRYSAYKALKNLSNEDHFVDWIFATENSRARGIAAYKTWADATFH